MGWWLLPRIPALPLCRVVAEAGWLRGVAVPTLPTLPLVSRPRRCLLDGQLGRSRFLPQREDGFLRFQLDTFLFPNASGSQVCASGVWVTPARRCGDRLDGWQSRGAARAARQEDACPCRSTSTVT